MFKDNLVQMRKMKQMTQEDIAEKVGVTRQAVAKWDGVVTVGDKGQIVIPAKARKTFDINPGDQLVVLGDEAQGLAVIKAESFLSIAEEVKKLQKATPEV